MFCFLPAGHKDGGRGGRLSKATCSAEGEVGDMASMTSFQIFSEFGRLDAWSNMGSQDGRLNGGQDHALRMVGLWDPFPYMAMKMAYKPVVILNRWNKSWEPILQVVKG